MLHRVPRDARVICGEQSWQLCLPTGEPQRCSGTLTLVLKTLVCSLAEARRVGCVCSESCEFVYRVWVIHNRNSGTLGKFALWIFTLLATFLIARATYPSRSPLRKEEFILAHSIKINSIMVGRAMGQEQESAGHIHLYSGTTKKTGSKAGLWDLRVHLQWLTSSKSQPSTSSRTFFTSYQPSAQTHEPVRDISYSNSSTHMVPVGRDTSLHFQRR